jgi:hypothetical protein
VEASPTEEKSMSRKNPVRDYQHASRVHPIVGGSLRRTHPVPIRMEDIAKALDRSDPSNAPAPEVEIERLHRHGIEGIHIYFK